jgi:hypothetical protein
MRNRQTRLHAACVLIFASFPLLYHAVTVAAQTGLLAAALGLLGVGVALALTT